MRSENNQSNWRLAAHINHSQCIIKSLSLASAGVRTLGHQVGKNLLEHTSANKVLQYSLLYPKLQLSTLNVSSVLLQKKKVLKFLCCTSRPSLSLPPDIPAEWAGCCCMPRRPAALRCPHKTRRRAPGRGSAMPGRCYQARPAIHLNTFPVRCGRNGWAAVVVAQLTGLE